MDSLEWRAPGQKVFTLLPPTIPEMSICLLPCLLSRKVYTSQLATPWTFKLMFGCSVMLPVEPVFRIPLHMSWNALIRIHPEDKTRPIESLLQISGENKAVSGFTSRSIQPSCQDRGRDLAFYHTHEMGHRVRWKWEKNTMPFGKAVAENY